MATEEEEYCHNCDNKGYTEQWECGEFYAFHDCEECDNAQKRKDECLEMLTT